MSLQLQLASKLQLLQVCMCPSFLAEPVFRQDFAQLCVLGMGVSQNFVHGINREKIPRYTVYRGTLFCDRSN